jgi:hypothetical protein
MCGITGDKRKYDATGHRLKNILPPVFNTEIGRRIEHGYAIVADLPKTHYRMPDVLRESMICYVSEAFRINIDGQHAGSRAALKQ